MAGFLAALVFLTGARSRSIAAIALLLGTASLPAAARSEQAPVTVFEVNGVEIYVPNGWLWWTPDQTEAAGDFFGADRPILRDNPAGIVYHLTGLTLFTLISRRENSGFARFPPPELWPDFWVYRVEFRPGARNVASFPREGLSKLTETIRSRLRPVDSDGFRRGGDGDTYYGARPDDITRIGGPLSFNCSSPHRPGEFSYCTSSNVRVDGLNVKYVWDERYVEKSEWRLMNDRVQRMVDWLVTPPDQRPSRVE